MSNTWEVWGWAQNGQNYMWVALYRGEDLLEALQAFVKGTAVHGCVKLEYRGDPLVTT